MVRVNQYIPNELIKSMKISCKKTLYRKNVNKYWEGDFVNGNAHGKYIRWNENGNKWWEVDIVNCERNGKVIQWREDGTKDFELDYVNGDIVW